MKNIKRLTSIEAAEFISQAVSSGRQGLGCWDKIIPYRGQRLLICATSWQGSRDKIYILPDGFGLEDFDLDRSPLWHGEVIR